RFATQESRRRTVRPPRSPFASPARFEPLPSGLKGPVRERSRLPRQRLVPATESSIGAQDQISPEYGRLDLLAAEIPLRLFVPLGGSAFQPAQSLDYRSD